MTPSNASRPTWAFSGRRLSRLIAQPTARFLSIEAASGLLLLVGTVAALVWVNSPWSAGYHALWRTELAIEIGGHRLGDTLHHWVNDGGMTLFFFVVGLEIKRELVTGQLRTARDAALPVSAALGGMVVPALAYLALNAGGVGAAGWGIPMATDIAFAVGVLALIGPRVPSELKVFLLGLAVTDDIGAVLVIAVAYTDRLALGWLAAAVAGVALMASMRRVRIWWLPAYVAVGTGVWFSTLQSGVHATIAGVVLGLLAPARPLLAPTDAEAIADGLSSDDHVTADEVRDIWFQISERVSIAERLERTLHPWTSYVIVPLFALANAGIPLSVDSLVAARSSPVTLGVVVGLVAGKFAGVLLFSLVAVRLRIARLPATVTWPQVGGVAALAGIGFTVSIFVSALAFDDPVLHDRSRLGVLAASVVAAAVGSMLLSRATRSG